MRSSLTLQICNRLRQRLSAAVIRRTRTLCGIDRYSCKKYSDRAVEPEKLTAILEAGRLAPTAKNLQEQHIYVVQSAEKLAVIDKLTPCRYGAPTVLVVAFDKNNVFTYPGEKRDSGVEDATIVAAHLILAAADEGVDSCWINYFDPDKAAELLGLPENEEVLMLLDPVLDNFFEFHDDSSYLN